MVYALFASSRLLPRQPSLLPLAFTRQKSITQAIQQGVRRDAPFRKPPPATPYHAPQDALTPFLEGSTRVERLREKFPLKPLNTREKRQQRRWLEQDMAKEKETMPGIDMKPRSGMKRNEDSWFHSDRSSSEGPETSGSIKIRDKRGKWVTPNAYANRLSRAGNFSNRDWEKALEEAPVERFGRQTDRKGFSKFAHDVREEVKTQYPRTAESDQDRLLKAAETWERPQSNESFESLPYTTAASEFIYGHSSVLAAIKANRRKLYKLYIHTRVGARDGFMAQIRAHKLFGITEQVGDDYLRAMDKASSGRPHNGVVLETSPLPLPPIVKLETPSIEKHNIGLILDSQSAEDVLVNGRNESFSYNSGGWRYPLILYLDRVFDEGNLGAIARSAYFLGVDAIVTSTHHIAPWSNIALKASAGAAEAIPIFKAGHPIDFLLKSSTAGWKIYASDAMPQAEGQKVQIPPGGTLQKETSNIVYTASKSRKRLGADHCPVAQHPSILMLGAEDQGLPRVLLNLAHYTVGIPHRRNVNEVDVDSLNVSVAASLLCYQMMQKPVAKLAHPSDQTIF